MIHDASMFCIVLRLLAVLVKKAPVAENMHPSQVKLRHELLLHCTCCRSDLMYPSLLSSGWEAGRA